MKLKITLLISCLLLTIRGGYAAAPESLRVRHAWATIPRISLYFDLLDTNTQAVELPQAQHFTLTVGSSTATIENVQYFEQTNEGVAYVLLVDISQSLKADQFAHMRTALQQWIQALTNKDRVAIVTFGNEVKLARDFTGDKESLLQTVATLAPTDNLTQLHQGLMRALEMGKRADANLPQYRVIVTLSDGQDDFPGGVTYQEVLDWLKDDRIPIYTLGFAPLSLSGREKDALRSLGVLARTSGGEYLEAKGDHLEADYAALQQRIRRVFVVRGSCPDCVADGRVQRMQLSHLTGMKSLTDGLSVRLLPHAAPSSTSPPKTQSLPVPKTRTFPYHVVSIVFVLILLGTALLLYRRDRPTIDERQESTSPIVTQSLSVMPEQEAAWGRLTVIGRARTAKTYLVGSRQAVIGRDPAACAVAIADDPEISGRHCMLVREHGAVFVYDLESQGGTLVNGVPIVGRHKLNEDDVLLLGRTKLRFSRISEANA